MELAIPCGGVSGDHLRRQNLLKSKEIRWDPRAIGMIGLDIVLGRYYDCTLFHM